MIEAAELRSVVKRLVEMGRISRSQSSRALTVLQLVQERALEQHFATELVVARWNARDLGVRIGERVYEVHLREATSYTGERYGPATRHNGLLEIRLRGPGLGYDGDRWRDQARTKLEEKVPLVLAAIHGVQAPQDIWERERNERLAERERQREASENARRDRQHNEFLEAQVLDQLQRWIRAGELRTYVERLRHRSVDLNAEARDDANTWIDWITGYIDRIDPENAPIVTPTPPSGDSARPR